MANRYPPTPSFGGAFPSLPYPSLPAQQNGHHLFAGRPPTTSPMGALYPASTGNSQSLNASHFAINAQIPSPGAVMPPIPHQFPPDLLKQLVNSSLPPPPPPSLPPVPIPNLGFSAYQPPPNIPNNFTPPQNHRPGNPTSSTAHAFENQEVTQPTSTQPSEVRTGLREEGELSDGELEERSAADSSRTGSREQASKMQISRNNDGTPVETQSQSGPSTRSSPPALKLRSVDQKADDFPPPYAFSQRYPHHATGSATAPYSQYKVAPEITSLIREDSGSSYDPPSVTTPELALDVSNGRDDTSQPVHGKSPSQMRELAKGALLSLAPHGIRFADLVREGVDADLLLQLYEEIGIKDSRPEISLASRTYEVTQASDEKATLSVSESEANDRSKAVPHQRPSGLSKTPVTTDLRDDPRVQQNMTKSNSDPLGQSKETEPISRQLQSLPLVSSASHVATPATNVAMERKDRIAQLLAAKTGKPALIRGTPDTPPAHAAAKSSTEAELQLKVSTNLAENTTSQNVSSQPVPKSMKNKAQTELVRQKMESLKKEAEAKARAQSQSQAFILTDANLPISDTNPTMIAPTPEQSISAHAHNQNVARADSLSGHANLATSYSQSLPRASPQANHVYRIPGLFLTSDEPLTTDERLSTTTRGLADQSAPISLDHENSFQQECEPSFTGDRSSAPESLTEFNLASLRNQSSTSRLPHKRPLAPDSFDEPMSPVKRPFGRKDSTEHIEIDVSNAASDDGSDGIGMDIDEDSQASGLLLSSAAPSKEASERDTQPSLPSSNLPERPFTQQHMPDSSLGRSTPSKEKDNEDLWRAKNAEIEAMRKRIAEMEQRRKAKQGQSQAQSPQASLPSTPAPSKVRASSPSQVSPSPGAILQASGTSPAQPLGSVHTILQKAADGDQQLSGLNSVPQSAGENLSRAEDLRKKLARRKELQDGIPNLDAEVQATQLKLAQTKARLAAIKREAEKREAEIHEARRREAEIAAEARKLEEQLNMGLKGRYRFSEELQSLGADLEAVPEVQTIFTESPGAKRTASSSDQALPPANTSPQSATHAMPVVAPATESRSEGGAPLKDVGAEGWIHIIDNAVAEEETAAAVDSFNQPFPSEAKNSMPAATSVFSGERYSELDDMLKSPPQIPGDGDSHESSIVPHDSDEDSLSIGNFMGAPSASLNGAGTGLDYENDGSVSMSDSGSDDYEPAEVQESMSYPDVGPEWFKPGRNLSHARQTQGEDSDLDDDYEPAEEVEPMELGLRNIQPLPLDNGTHSRSPKAGISNEQSSEPYSPGSDEKPAIDGVEDGSGLSDANMLTITQDLRPQQDVDVETDDVSRRNQAMPTHFSPYQSPLFFSKNFRFDPNFTALVAEAEGGTCSDSTCEEQHFRDMTLPDDKILVEMSSARDFKQGDQRDKFLIGLKQVIAELRSTGVKEFPTVAQALATYRRTFAESIDPNRAIPS